MARGKKSRGRKPNLGAKMISISREIDECIGSEPECVVKVLEAAVEASRSTAAHVAENWQDRKMAGRWYKIADRIATCASKVKKELPF
jgi:uncharacterized protein (DUF2252 family)